MSKLTVAIVTARENADTTYDKWRELGRRFLNGEVKDKYLVGEWTHLLANLVTFEDQVHHVYYQLNALAHQLDPPDRVVVVDRLGHDPGHQLIALPFEVQWLSPVIFQHELAAHPHVGLTESCDVNRFRDKAYGNADKNSAIVYCETEWLAMLDDCCIPSPAFCTAAREICEVGNIGLVGHRVLYLPTENRDHIEVGESNWQEGSDRNVFGIWAMPIDHILGVNGYSLDLDGKRGGWDAELKKRMDLYAQNRNLEFVIDKRLRCYEIEHTYPWGDEKHPPVTEVLRWKAPGPDLSYLRGIYLEAVKNAEPERPETFEEAVIEAVTQAVEETVDDHEEED